MSEKELLQAIDFDWTRNLDSIWDSHISQHVAELHPTVMDDILSNMERMRQTRQSSSPLGMVLNGPAGSGKTHLISSLRQSLIDRAFFVLVDMTDVKSFWNTVRQGYLESITHDGLYQGNNRRPQYEAILLNLLSQIPSVKNPEKTLKSLSEVANTAKIAEYADKVLFGPLHRQYRSEISKYKDVLRALLLLNSRSFEISDVGYSWLQGIDQDESTKKSYGFHWHTANPHLVVEGLSWAMSLVAPTLLAFDQMDAIVAQHHIATAGAKSAGDMTEEQAASAAIIHELAGGLMAIRDTSFRTLSLVSCLSHTWEILKNEAVRSFEDRFQLPAFNLSNIRSSEIAARIIRKRVERAAAETQLPLPDSPWPFSTQALSQILMSPRELLKNCHQSRQLGLRQGQYSELSFESDAPTSAPPTNDALSSLDKQFLAFQQDADLEALNNLKNEDSLMDELIESGCRSLIRENPLPDNMDLLLDEDFSLKNGRPTLHARLRMVLHSEHDREQHYSFRVIQQTSGISLQSRLRAAMTASGIDRKLSFRSLIIVRTLPLPNGPATRRLWEEFLSNGGIHINPTETEWRILFALRTMEQVKPDGFEDWLLARKPASKLALFKRIELTSEHAKSNPPVESPTKVENLTAAINNIVNTRQPGTNSGAVTNPEPNPTTNPEPTEPLTIDPNLIPVGRRLIGTEQKEILGISLENLIKHTVVLASSGSGKTVLVRRMIEEAALLGIPSIVIDPANDLARLGDKWPAQPASWSETDANKAERYFNEVDVKIWTPGKESGRPFKLAPMPDFSELQQDPDELEAALLLSLELLKGMLLSGKSNTNEVKAGLLMGCLRYMAHQGESGLAYLIELLKEMPPEATGGISGASKHGVSMANQLIAQCMSDPLLRGSADPVQVEALWENQGRALISVVNLHGLPSLDLQQRFVAQLAGALFTAIKKKPGAEGQAVKGLLIIDEAKDFTPSQGNPASKAPLLRLAAQARKYGLGLIFATQQPGNIDHTVTANSTNHIYGKANSPRAIEVIRNLIQLKGGSGNDVPKLNKGQFYCHSEGYEQPLKVQSPLCLSYHGDTPLSEEEVIQRARIGQD